LIWKTDEWKVERHVREKEDLNMKNRRTWLYGMLVLTGGFIGGALATEMVPAVAIAAKQARTIKAQQFVLVDKDGAERGAMEVTADGTADLGLMDATGRNRGEFQVTKQGTAAVALYDQHGAQRVVVGEPVAGRRGVAIYGSNGRQLALLSVTDNNESNLTLYDPSTGRARVGLGVTPEGEPGLALFDKNGKDRLELHIGRKGTPGIALADEGGKTIAGLPEESAK
jgi:hypothetical protein